MKNENLKKKFQQLWEKVRKIKIYKKEIRKIVFDELGKI